MRLSVQQLKREQLPHAGVATVARIILDGVDITSRGVIVADEELGVVRVFVRDPATGHIAGDPVSGTPRTEVLTGAVRIECREDAPAPNRRCYEELRRREAARGCLSGPER